jgi:hypothetical protein
MNQKFILDNGSIPDFKMARVFVEQAWASPFLVV